MECAEGDCNQGLSEVMINKGSFEAVTNHTYQLIMLYLVAIGE